MRIPLEFFLKFKPDFEWIIFKHKFKFIHWQLKIIVIELRILFYVYLIFLGYSTSNLGICIPTIR